MDAPMRWLDTLPIDQWKPLNVGLKKYLTALAHDRAISNTMIEHAVVLHTDVAIFGGPAAAGPRSVGWLATPPPALVKSMDGELIGSTEANWHWIFARALIDLIDPSPRNDSFAPAWYHAAAAFMLQHGLDGELGPHFERAAILFPRDANLVFDRACLAEGIAMPRSQLVSDDLREKQAAERRTATFVPGQIAASARAPITLPTADQANAQAERFFRQTLDIDPTFAEARVRLARLLENRGKAAEALVELGAAAKDLDQRDHVLLFYSHLIAARAHQALSDLPEASADVRAALALYPDAQSALIVESELALRSADADGALAPLRRLTARQPETDDPWWLYDIGAGRAVDRLVPALWTRVNASRRP
jgi:tetratricopeptide (TPR) repeat protein